MPDSAPSFRSSRASRPSVTQPSADAAPRGTGAFGLEGRVAVVTGASSGIGHRIARALSAAGAHVVLAARRAGPIEELADALPSAVAVPTDVTDAAARTQLVEAALDAFGAIDVLVNNAGVVNVVPAEDEDEGDFRRVVETNLVAPFALCRLVAPHMLTAGAGSIVNVASILGVVGTGKIPQASYAASKGGLVSLTRELAAQWARRGVRVNALAPGWFASEMTAPTLGAEQGRRFIERNTPMGRAGEPYELDGAVVFLASDASSYMTGQVLVVDGGWTVV